MDPINVDPRIYGGEAPVTTEVPTIDPLAVGGAPKAPYVPPAPADAAAAIEGTQAVQDGKEAIARATRTEATYGESAKAAVKTWGATRVWDYVNAPKFAHNPNFDPKPFVRNVPFALDEDEHKFLASSNSEEQFAWRLERTESQRKLYEQMGDHPVLSTALGFLDPLDLLIDVASVGTASAATRGLKLTRAAGRAMAGTEAAGLTAAAGNAQQQVAPVSDGEILFNTLVNGAASAAFFNPKAGRFQKADPEFPTDGLHQAAVRGTAEAAPMEARILSEGADAAAHARASRVPEVEPEVAPANTDVVVTPVAPTAGRAMPASTAVPDVVPTALPKELTKATPNYNYGTRAFGLTFDSDLDRAAYIVSGNGKSKAHAKYADWLESNGYGLDEAEKYGKALRAGLKEKAKAAPANSKGIAVGGGGLQRVNGRVNAPRDPVIRYNSANVTDDYLAGQGAKNFDEATDTYTMLARHEADPDFGPMIRTLRAEHGDALSAIRTRVGDVERAFYSKRDATVYVDRKSSSFVALHEAVHGLTVQKLAYGKANPGSAHGRLVSELEGLRKDVEAHIASLPPDRRGMLLRQDGDASKSYFTQDLEEFTAGLYAGKKDSFTTLLSQMPAPGYTNALTKMVGVIRKLLGIHPKQESVLTRALGLTEELMRIKAVSFDNATSKFATYAPDGIHFAPSGTPTQVAQQVGGWWDKQAKRAANKMEWSLNKTLRQQGTQGNLVADILVDDPINMTGNSAVSQRQAIRNDLARLQHDFEDELKDQMAAQGAGVRQRVFNSGEAIKVQQRIEADLAAELARRANMVRRGQPIADPRVDPKLTKLADLHDKATAAGLKEMDAAGVRGASGINSGAGYNSRKWDVGRLEAAEGAFEAAGMTSKAARKQVRLLIAEGIRRADGTIPQDIAEDMALAITERTRRKGYMEDAVEMGTMGDDGAQGIRAILQGSGLDSKRMQMIEDFMKGRKDDAGIMSNLKNRIDMDMLTKTQMPDGSSLSLLDLVDGNLVRNLDGYLDDAAGQAGLARKGLFSMSDVTKLRADFLAGVADESQRRIAAGLFDNTIKAIKGQPVGEELTRAMRNLSAVTTAVGLANSGMWQLMEYANIATKYGMGKTFKQMLSRMPIAKQLMSEVAGNVNEAGSMAQVLSRNSSQDLRIRPFLSKLEDNFTIPTDDRLTLALQQAKQLVPYINAMKYVHSSQANITANLINDLVQRGVKGDAKARKALSVYGLEGHQLDAMKLDIQTHGMTVDKWSDGTWANVRGPLGKMMDDAVLKNRTGELPAFAQFSTLGKFIFTFRSFVLGAHNKVLAGTLGRHGLAGLGLLMAYQFPLAMATTYAVESSRGKPPSDHGKLAANAVSQMSAFGLLTELFGVVSGEKRQFGSSGLMAIDRLYKTTSQAASGNFAQAGGSLASAVPLLAIMPGIKALAEAAK